MAECWRAHRVHLADGPATKASRMTLIAVAASDRRTELFRLSPAGAIEHRWLVGGSGQARWSPWSFAPFTGTAIGLAAISGWSEQVEVFVLDDTGGVWNRWWWEDRGWEPADGFEFHGRPFGDEPVRSIAALSAGGGHFDVFVEALDGRIAVLPHLDRPGPRWLLCTTDAALGDGWWPAFGDGLEQLYRVRGARPTADTGPQDSRR